MVNSSRHSCRKMIRCINTIEEKKRKCRSDEPVYNKPVSPCIKNDCETCLNGSLNTPFNSSHTCTMQTSKLLSKSSTWKEFLPIRIGKQGKPRPHTYHYTSDWPIGSAESGSRRGKPAHWVKKAAESVESQSVPPTCSRTSARCASRQTTVTTAREYSQLG